MNKQQNRILSVIYKNAENGVTIDEISKQSKVSKDWVRLEIAELMKINAISEHPGETFKPSTGKLKMMC